MPALSAVPQAASGETIRLGSYEYTVVPQRIGRLRRHLGRAMSDLESLGGDSLAEFVGASLERAHGLLKVFIPDLMPIYEFSGYRSEAAMEADEDDDGDWGPTFPDIVNAFEVVMRVNRLDLLGHLRSVISPELIRAYISSRMADVIRDSQTSSSASSASTPGPPSQSTDSGMTLPTLEPSLG